MKLEALTQYLDDLLAAPKFRDYCPNGLQVEGSPEVMRILCGVTASQALLDLAVARGAQAVLVHHGYFWKGEDARIQGLRKRRLATLLRHDISLIAYHLPLDAHPVLGNNAQLAAQFGWQESGRFGDQEIAWLGTLPAPSTVKKLQTALTAGLGRAPMVIGEPERPVHRIAWCSGGAQGYFEEAIARGVDVYVSGEISEQTVHLARESGVAYVAAGHHATERGGIRALAAHLREACGLECEFVDLDNPV